MSFDTERCTAHTKCNMASVSIFHSAWFLVYVGTFSTNQKICVVFSRGEECIFRCLFEIRKQQLTSGTAVDRGLLYTSKFIFRCGILKLQLSRYVFMNTILF